MKMVRGLALILGAATAALAFSAGPASAHGHGDRHHGHGHGNRHGHGHSQSSHGNIGLLNGNQVLIPVHIPVNVCGNSVALLGLASSNAGCVND